jgi:alpha-1,2-mannosyltransferase
MVEGLVCCTPPTVSPYQVNRQLGYHATTATEFADAFEGALSLPDSEVDQMRTRARNSARRFDGETFDNMWLKEFDALMQIK